MIRIFFFTVLICGCHNCIAQIKKFTAKEIEKTFSKVNDTLYASQYETSNFEFNTFLNEVAQKDSSLYLEYRVDSVKWTEPGYYNQPMSEYYHGHPGFKNYPVLCISYESAVAYCNWLTDLYNNDSKRKFRKIVFGLPSEEEWELAATDNIKNRIYPWGSSSLRETRKGSWQGMFLANYRHIGDGSVISDSNGKPVLLKVEREIETGGLNDRAIYTATVHSFFPNSLGIYNQSGNAAEMTSLKGLTKGGSWNSYGGEITITYKLYFNESSPEVGFRVFMKVVEK